MTGRKSHLQIVARARKSSSPRDASAPPPPVSPRWLLKSVAASLVAAAFCAWATLCLFFWQGSWRLLYHPQAAVARTPASAAIAYDPVRFAATETGVLRLAGWWIPAAPNAPLSRFTILYLHAARGNLGDSVDALALLHALGVNVLAFDYRGFGESQSAHPSEARWLEDANWALDYLTQTRHIDARAIVLMGDELGADLALELAAAHPELAGVVLDSPLADPMSAIFGDPIARLVPTYLLAKDRYDIGRAATALRIPSLWLLPPDAAALAAFSRVSAPHQRARIDSPGVANRQLAIENWLQSLPVR